MHRNIVRSTHMSERNTCYPQAMGLINSVPQDYQFGLHWTKAFWRITGRESCRQNPREKTLKLPLKQHSLFSIHQILLLLKLLVRKMDSNAGKSIYESIFAARRDSEKRTVEKKYSVADRIKIPKSFLALSCLDCNIYQD